MIHLTFLNINNIGKGYIGEFIFFQIAQVLKRITLHMISLIMKYEANISAHLWHLIERNPILMLISGISFEGNLIFLFLSGTSLE